MTAERVNQLLLLLPECGLPEDLERWLHDGLVAWQAGADLHTALCLDGPDNDRRDDLLRTVIALSPGGISHCKDCVYCGVSQGR